MNIIGELSELAKEAEGEQHILAESAQLAETLKIAAEQVGRSWSRSNLGYQARVYYGNFDPVPAGVVFSSEWGLEDRWPVNTPDRGWQVFDEDAPRSAIVERAGGIDPTVLDAPLARGRKRFAALRDNLVSILSASLKWAADPFLQNRLDEIEKIEPPSPESVGARMVPRRQVMTRDTLALGEGLRPAPHQSVLAFTLSFQATDEALGLIARVARVSASHIARLEPEGPRGVQAGGQVTFVGHGRSLMWRVLKDFLKDRLGLSVSEFNAVSAAGVPTVERLTEMLGTAAFAFIIMTGEDETADGELRARQNVIHEAGLFQGRLGFGKAIILLEEGCSDFSNIHGLGVIPFARGDIGTSFEEVRRVLEREQLIASG